MSKIPEPVSASKVALSETGKGFWNGMKKGLMWGGIGGAVTSGAIGYTALSTGASAAGGFIGGVAKIPVVGPALAAAGGYAAYQALPTGATVEGAKMVLSTALPFAAIVTGSVAAVGGVVGGLWGAVTGYMDSGKEVTRQETERARKVALARHEARQHLRDRELLAQQKQEFEKLGHQLGYDIAQLTPPATPGRAPEGRGHQA